MIHAVPAGIGTIVSEIIGMIMNIGIMMITITAMIAVMVTVP